MKLIDLLEVYNDSCSLILDDYNTLKQLGVYNGKDSIDSKYNDWTVEFISVRGSNTLAVAIRCD
jgi:hypothetical protein